MGLFSTTRTPTSVIDRAVDPLQTQLGRIREYTTPEMQAWEQSLLELAKQYSPQYLGLSGDLYSQYGPQLAATDSAIAAQQYQAALDAAQKAAPQVAQIEAAAEPDYVNTRALIAKGFADLLGGMNPNELSGSELEQVTRGVNRSNISRGTAGTGSSTEALKNVTTFGDALTAKKKDFTSALNSATNFLGSSRTGNLRVPQYQQLNYGLGSQYSGVKGGLGQTGQAWAQNIFAPAASYSASTGTQKGALSDLFGVGTALGSITDLFKDNKDIFKGN